MTVRHLAAVIAALAVLGGPNAIAANAKKKSTSTSASGAESAPAANDEEATKRARAHFDKGSKLYKQARYKDAIAEFEAAYKEKPHGVLFFNIAQSYEKLGDISQALRNYHEYLRSLPDAEDKATVEVAMKNLEARLAEKGVQQLLVYSNPPNAQVLIDGKPAGNAPLVKELPLGKHKVAVEIEGYALNERAIELTAASSLVLDFTLEKRTETVPLVSAPDTATPVADPNATKPKDAPVETKTITAMPADTTPPPLTDASATATAPKPEKKRVWTYVGAGVTAAAAITAAVLGGMAKSNADQLMASPSSRDKTTANALHDSAVNDANASNVMYGVAGVAGAATVALFFVEGSF